ncbi:MAG: hypothetical protein QOF57_2407 [Frankiaceae bacterium]|nr:hypothetical protein [Frankiaceae bacterium]
MRPRRTFAALGAAFALLAPVVAHAAYDPASEAKNYSKINERFDHITGTPEYQADLRVKGQQREADLAHIIATDGPPDGRDTSGNLCAHKNDGCAGDVRLYDWADKGYGIARPILFTARNGSTLSGHLWMTADGPAKRPGVVITNGSVQAPEELYWFAAQTLAKAGYVVMTWDPQGQGLSDTYGAGVDRNDGVPSQTGRPFFDGTEDALDFFFSTRDAPYAPRKSCTTGTDHGDKQRARVLAGKASAYNPLAASIDYSRVGIAGHSLGAAAVSFVGQIDPRVRAIVAWDNLSAPAADFNGTKLDCTSGSSPRPATVAPVVPALGMSADYFLTPTPYTSEPDPLGKSAGSLALSKAGVDTGQVNIRGGTHYEFSFIPNPGFGATLRGVDEVAWYTRAWMDRYVKGGDATAARRLQTGRWRKDAQSGAVDPDGDQNMYSSYFRSRMDIGRDGAGTFACEDLRAGCPGLGPDGEPVPYDFLPTVLTKDGAGAGGSTRPAGADGVPPAATGPGALTKAAAASDCRDATAPTSRFAHRRTRITATRLLLRGIASDRSCGKQKGKVVGVTVSVARASGKRCRFLRPDGSFGAPVSCLRTTYLPASGTSSWTFDARGRFARGGYKVFVRGVDAAGNVERKDRTRNFTRVRRR